MDTTTIEKNDFLKRHFRKLLENAVAFVITEHRSKRKKNEFSYTYFNLYVVYPLDDRVVTYFPILDENAPLFYKRRKCYKMLSLARFDNIYNLISYFAETYSLPNLLKLGVIIL